MRKAYPLIAALFVLMSASCAIAQPHETLDAFWAEVSRTVAEGDYEAYGATYHPDAVLVNGISGESYPIATALSGWEQGFIDTREGRSNANVVFRFTQRLNDERTAHETGMFYYTFGPADGDMQGAPTHFEALLVWQDGWKMVMEYQKAPATMEDWEAASE